MSEIKLTKAALRLLKSAMKADGQAKPSPTWGGLKRAEWHAKMSQHVADGFFSPCFAGSYASTPAGLSALQAQKVNCEHD